MSYNGQEEEEDKRPVFEKAPLIVLEHRIRPPPDAKQTNRIYSKYAILKATILIYGNIPNEKVLAESKLDARDYIDLEYGTGRRMHTEGDLADKRAAELFSDSQLNLSLRAKGLNESNTATLNQNQNIFHSDKRNRGGHWYNPFSWGK